MFSGKPNFDLFDRKCHRGVGTYPDCLPPSGFDVVKGRKRPVNPATEHFEDTLLYERRSSAVYQRIQRVFGLRYSARTRK